MEPENQPKQRHVHATDKLELKTNRPLLGFIFIALSVVFAYYLYDRYYGDHHFAAQLEAGILKR